MSTAVVGDNKADEVKGVRVWGLPPRGVSIASGDGYGAKSFTTEEIESAVRNGLALGVSTCPAPWDIPSVSLHNLNSKNHFYSFSN